MRFVSSLKRMDENIAKLGYYKTMFFISDDNNNTNKHGLLLPSQGVGIRKERARSHSLTTLPVCILDHSHGGYDEGDNGKVVEASIICFPLPFSS